MPILQDSPLNITSHCKLVVRVNCYVYSKPMTSKYKYIEKACRNISAGNLDSARQVINDNYPFEVLKNKGRQYSYFQKTRVFIRDGFIDRYSGDKLIFPPVLRVMSTLMPSDFPFHKNWKISECHIAYWQLCPTIDHIIPVSRGGEDVENNWVCTTQLKNNAKSNWLLKELGWELKEPGKLEDWDGMIHWFLEYSDKNPIILEDKYVLSWLKAARKELTSK